jgi:hypothetical protein
MEQPMTSRRLFGALLLCAFASTALAETKFVLDVQPLSVLLSPKADEFRTTRREGFVFQSEEIEGELSAFPTLRIGAGFERERRRVDLTVGGGVLANEAFVVGLLRADAALHRKFGERGRFGPHAGIVYFADPNWRGEADLRLKGGPGFLGGLDFAWGRERLSFYSSLDYLFARFDAKGRNGWTVTDDRIDLSGLALQVGFTGRY